MTRFPPTQPAEMASLLHQFRRVQRWWRSLLLPRWVRLPALHLLYALSPRAREVRAVECELQAPALSSASLLPRPAEAIPPGGLVVSGFLSDVSGIGRGGRMSVAAFEQAGVRVQTHDLRHAPEGWGETPNGGVWFAHCNAPEGMHALNSSASPRGCYRIGYWAWELPQLPESWTSAAAFFHEIWAPSEFTAGSIRRATRALGLPVRVAPHPLPDVSDVAPDRVRFGFAEGVTVFLCMYDVLSSATRKNPAGAIEAFQRAFGPSRADALLVVKVVSADRAQGCLEELRARTAGWENIRFLTETLSDVEANSLIASADVFVSLHRSEGFGLSIAQAMALGRATIATGWSGNVDFCGEGVALVPYRLIPVDDPTGVYTGVDQVWADPDVEAAAQEMQRLAADRIYAQALGAAAKLHVNRCLPVAYDIGGFARWLAPGVVGAAPSEACKVC